MTTVEVLRAARERIEKGWCQGTYARRSDGTPADHADPGTVAWCASGALWNDASPCDLEVYADAAAVLESYLPRDLEIEDWNDAPGRDKAEVLNLFDKAIEETSCE